MEAKMSKKFLLNNSMIETLTRLKHRLDLDTEGEVILRAVALLSVLEREKDVDGNVTFLSTESEIKRINIVG